MSTAGGGLFGSLRRLLDTVLGIVQTRLELIGTELEQEKLRLLGALWQGALALLLFGLALVCALGFVVLMFWEGYRLPAMGVMTLLLAGGGWWLLQRARAALRSPEGGMFALSLGELRRDRDGLDATSGRTAARAGETAAESAADEVAAGSPAERAAAAAMAATAAAAAELAASRRNGDPPRR